jgi:hypothetical protein
MAAQQCLNVHLQRDLERSWDTARQTRRAAEGFDGERALGDHQFTVCSLCVVVKV